MENLYESVFILNPGLKDEDVDKWVSKISQVVIEGQGTVEKSEKWGKRKLTFEINGQKEGNYIFLLIKGPTSLVTDLAQTYRVSEDVIRFLTTRVEIIKKIPSKIAKKLKKEAAKRELARAAAAPKAAV